MLTINRATLVGHAGRNPEMRTLPSGDEVALFSLATTERFKRRDGTEGEATEWHAIVAFGAAAETVRTLVRRGDPVLVEGRIATRSWTDRKGTEHRTTEIVVAGPRSQVNVLAKRRREPDGGDEPPGAAAAAGAAEAADADRDEGSADAVAVAASARRKDAGTGKDAGTAGPPEDAASAEAVSAGAEGDAASAADTTGRPEPSEADSAAGGTPDGDSTKSSVGGAESPDAGDAVETGVDGRSGDAGHD